jgi:hypothetical protein
MEVRSQNLPTTFANYFLSFFLSYQLSIAYLSTLPNAQVPMPKS